MWNPNDDQKRYDKFIELVREAYEHTHKKQDVYTSGQRLWNEAKNDHTTYQSARLYCILKQIVYCFHVYFDHSL